MPGFKIRVTKSEQNEIRFELMHDHEKVADVTFYEIIEMVGLLTDMIRDMPSRGSAALSLYGQEIEVTFVGLVDMATQFASSLRWHGVK